MFTFHFKNFFGNLDIQAPTHDGIPPDSPIFIFYQEKENLSKHEILRRFNRILNNYRISYLRPLRNLTGEWIFDLQEFKNSFKCFKDTKYLKGKITIEPDFLRNIETDEYTDEITSEETTLKFSIYPEDLQSLNTAPDLSFSEELNEPLKRFRKDFKSTDKCGFLMMKYEDSKIQTEITDIIKNHFAEKGMKLLRADDKWYADDLLLNIKTYMHGYSFGVALFERINTNYFNPNVSLEIGYMMAMNKPILFLKDCTLTSLQTDLIGKLYHEYDFQYPEGTLPYVIDKWTQSVQIESNEVEKIEKISREVTELLNQGVNFYSEAPRYYYTQMADLKIEIISKATEDARIRAEKIAAYSNGELGALQSAKMGVFQITGQNSTENYSWEGTFNTSSRDKTASITMKLVYKVK